MDQVTKVKPEEEKNVPQTELNSKPQLITYHKEPIKEEELLTSRKKMFEDVFAENFDSLKNVVQEICLDMGFKLCQSTGLKAKKYAYFYCSFSQKNQSDQPKKSKSSSIKFLVTDIKIFYRKLTLSF